MESSDWIAAAIALTVSVLGGLLAIGIERGGAKLRARLREAERQRFELARQITVPWLAMNHAVSALFYVALATFFAVASATLLLFVGVYEPAASLGIGVLLLGLLTTFAMMHAMRLAWRELKVYARGMWAALNDPE